MKALSVLMLAQMYLFSNNVFFSAFHQRQLYALITVESEAFTGLDGADVIFIPSGVTSIADDAFDPDMVIQAEEDAYALQWARDHGFGVIAAGK